MDAPNRDLVSLPARTRDLSDVRLWVASGHRSAERRRVAARSRRGLDPRSATASFAIVVAAGAAAMPAVSLASPSGLADVQRALGVTPDGVMGPQTRAALRRFQRSHGLPADGVVGPRTRAALGVDGDASPAAGDGTGSSSPRQAASSDGAGASLRDAQAALGVTADGVMGPKTRAALRRFQGEHDLPATGRLDAATSAALAQDGDAGQTDPDAGDGTSAGDETAAAAPETAAEAPAAGSGLEAAVAAARAQIGKPYGRSGTGPSGFDCSGLTQFAFKAAGISLARSSFGQYAQGTAVQKPAIQPGDLVFFNTAGSGASHVGVATSATTMISATTRGVMESSFASGYWASHYVGARRVSS